MRGQYSWRDLYRVDRLIRLVLVPLVAMTLIPVVAGGDRTAARSRYRVTSSRVARGVTIVRMQDRRGPNRIRVLKIDPSQRPVIDVALANDSLPGHETTSSMARRHGAIAAINGDYTIRPNHNGAGRPVDTFIEDGFLKASPLIYGRNFSISRDEQNITFGHNRLRTWLTQQDSGETWTLADANPVSPHDSGFSVFTQAGGWAFQPPRFACSARLLTNEPLRWTKVRDGVTQDLVVDKVACRSRRMGRRGGIVVTAPWGSTNGAILRANLIEGERVTYAWSFKRTGVLDTIGGNPDLLEDGQYAIGQCTSRYFCGRNPRTGIGVTGGGVLLLVTVDGRQKKSVGMTPWEFADLFKRLGATDALNLDGGGSTTMYLRGEVVNRPSGGHERAVGSALLVLTHADRGETEPASPSKPPPIPPVEPTPSPSPATPSPVSPSPMGSPTTLSTTTSPSPSPSVPGVVFDDRSLLARDPFCQALLDPGSTGGLLHALSRGDFGTEPASLPYSFRWGLRVFRGDAICR